MARNFGCRPSQLLKIESDVTAFDFDRLCNFRLMKFDNERDAERFKIYFNSLGFMLTGKELPNDEEPTEPDEDDVW